MVLRKIHHQRPHHRSPFARHLPRSRIDIRQQPIAQPNIPLPYLLSGLVPLPYLFTGPCSMHAEHRVERTILEPAGEELLIGFVLWIAAEKSANISIPVQDAADRDVQTGGETLLLDVPS